MKNILTASAKPVEKNADYKGENFIVGVRYGGEGISPCIQGKCKNCVSSSGESYCGNYAGHIDIEVEGKTLHIVRCFGYTNCSG